MKRYIITFTIVTVSILQSLAQSTMLKQEGKCGTDIKWTFDGYTLTIKNTSPNNQIVSMDDYDIKSYLAPWTKRKLNVRKVVVGVGINRIGSCAFANLSNLQEIVFESTFLKEIRWGAFLNCTRLRNISLPVNLQTIGVIAFANCSQLPAIKIPDKCRVGDYAFASCVNLKAVETGPTTILGYKVFANEMTIDGKKRHVLYDGDIRMLPSYVNIGNCRDYGFARKAVNKYLNNTKHIQQVNYDMKTSIVDSMIPNGYYSRNSTYALIIGNQNYRFVSDVPYAIHDARVFAEYCKKTLGLPIENIHIAEDATKQMILEEELEDWAKAIPNREMKKLIVYYAGHGVPDIKNNNKAYLLPTDVRGTNPKRGIALDDFYNRIGELGFNQTSIFLDACFSGVNRDNEGVSEGLRGVEIEAEQAELGDGTLIVFSAAQGNETAQGFAEEGHGLFTYFLLRAMQESEGYFTFGQLSDYIYNNVTRQAMQLKLRKKQTPQTKASEKATDWRTMQF